MIRKRYNKNNRDRIYVKANHQVRFPEVRVLGEHGDSLGLMSSKEAYDQARAQDKDLVLITEKAQPPVVKIIELSKYKYQLKKKAADNRKKAKVQDLKEVRFSPFMGEGDFAARSKRVREFLEKGDKVKLSLLFKGRQITKKDFGYEMFDKIITSVEDIAKVEMPSKMIGKKLQAQLTPIGNKK